MSDELLEQFAAALVHELQGWLEQEGLYLLLDKMGMKQIARQYWQK